MYLLYHIPVRGDKDDHQSLVTHPRGAQMDSATPVTGDRYPTYDYL